MVGMVAWLVIRQSIYGLIIVIMIVVKCYIIILHINNNFIY